jgi:hypothetical protein
MFASLNVHTEVTIALGREKVAHFYELITVCFPLASHISLNLKNDLSNIEIHCTSSHWQFSSKKLGLSKDSCPTAPF